MSEFSTEAIGRVLDRHVGWHPRRRQMVAEIEAALVPWVAHQRADALREAAEVVRSGRDAFLSSDNLDPAWIAGWHSATDHHVAQIAPTKEVGQ